MQEWDTLFHKEYFCRTRTIATLPHFTMEKQKELNTLGLEDDFCVFFDRNIRTMQAL